jgi:hypothetical protein
MERKSAQETVSGGTNTQHEAIHVRNFDVMRSYDLTVQIRDSSGLVFANRYYLTPGKTASEFGRMDAGEYEVHVELDSRRIERARCEIDDTPDGTARIEVGNGTVSVSEGLYP